MKKLYMLMYIYAYICLCLTKAMGLYVSPIQCICMTSHIYITITSHPFMHVYIQYEYFIIEKLQLYGRLIAGTCARDLPPFFLSVVV